MIEIELPKSDVESRIEWAGERYADLCEGQMQHEVGWFVWGVIVGWLDVGMSDNEALQYRTMANLFAEFLENDK